MCLLTAVLADFKGRESREWFLRLWALCGISLSAGGFIYFYLWYTDHHISRLVLYVPYTVALSFLWLGARALRGASFSLSIGILPPLIIVLSDFVGRLYGRPALPAVTFHALTLVLLAVAAAEIRRVQIEQMLDGGRELLAVLAFCALVPIWRLCELAIGVQGHSGALAALTVAVLGVAVPLAGLHFLRERETLQQSTSRQADLLAWRKHAELLLNGLPLITSLRQIAPGGRDVTIFRTGDINAVTGLNEKNVDADRSLLVRSLDDPEVHRAFHTELLAKGRASLQWRLRSADGSVRWMQTHSRVIDRRADGGALAVSYTVDNTAQRAGEAKLLASARLSALGEMALGLAHELRQPLTVISLAAERIRWMIGESGAKELVAPVERIVQHCRRASDIIENLRRVAISDSAEQAPRLLSVQAVLKDTLTLIGGALRNDNIEVVLDLGEYPPTVLGEDAALQQVFFNLFSNARHALMELPEGRPRRIRVSTRPAENGFVCVSVADTGNGIPPEILERIFEPFLTTKGPDKGTGLGLSISRSLVNGMGGSIDARNATTGAVFDVFLRAA